MRNETIPKQAAYELLRRYGIIRPTLNNVIYIIEDYGYEVVDYDASSITLTSEDDSVENHLINSVAFTYCKGKTKIVFFNDSLTEQEKLYVAAHELGHICLGHLNHKSTFNPSEEFAANEFTHYLLVPNLGVRFFSLVKSYRKESIAILIGLLVLAAAIWGGVDAINRSIYYGDFYVCEHGEKYHLPTCQYVTRSSTAHRMTQEEFESKKYEPCLVCKPDG